MIHSAAARIRLPSVRLAKYSALLCPYTWLSSAGRAAIVSIISAMTAPARLTSDSIASDSRPTEFVSKYAPVLSTIVESAPPMDSHANRVSEARFCIKSACSAFLCGMGGMIHVHLKVGKGRMSGLNIKETGDQPVWTLARQYFLIRSNAFQGDSYTRQPSL